MEKCWHSVTSPAGINCTDITKAVCDTDGHKLRGIISHFPGLHQISDNTEDVKYIFRLADIKSQIIGDRVQLCSLCDYLNTHLQLNELATGALK